MSSPIPFTFGIALVAKRRARDWEVVESLLRLTLASVLGQTDQDFDVVIAGHDRPEAMPDDPRFRFIEVSWPPDRPDQHNSDGGMKKYRIGEDLLARGGGLLMLLDADDWVDRRLVEVARARIGPEHVGGLIEHGYAVDLQTLRALRLPDPRAFDIGFHRICGSSALGRLDPAAAEPVRRDPCHALGSHHQWLEAAKANGVTLVHLPAAGSYLINTSENHSEHHGPHAAWRRDLAARVREFGLPLDAGTAARFGVALPEIERLSARLNQNARRS